MVWLCDENQDEAFATDDLYFKGLSDRGVAGAKVIEAQKKKKKTFKGRRATLSSVWKSGKERYRQICLKRFHKKSKTPEKTTSKKPSEFYSLIESIL